MEKVISKFIDKLIVPNYDLIDYTIDNLREDGNHISRASHQIKINLNPELEESDVEKLDAEMKDLMGVLGFRNITTTTYFFPNLTIYMLFATI